MRPRHEIERLDVNMAVNWRFGPVGWEEPPRRRFSCEGIASGFEPGNAACPPDAIRELLADLVVDVESLGVAGVEAVEVVEIGADRFLA